MMRRVCALVMLALPSSGILATSFQFDGNSSDIAKQLYLRFQDGDSVDKMSVTDVPDTITERLDELGLSFDDLPGLVQRAVVWDSGYVLDSTSNLIKVWTLDGFHMDEIAVSKEEYEATSCKTLPCPQPTNHSDAYSNYQCTGTQMLIAVKCVVEAENKYSNSGLSMWSTGGDPDTMIPEINLKQHNWSDEGGDYLLFSIHTQSNEPKYGECPTDDGYRSLVVPCYGIHNITEDVKSKMTETEPREWVTTWLEDFQASTSASGSSTMPSSSDDDSFQFDGNNSDIAQQLYIRYKKNDAVDRMKINGTVPDAITRRLDDMGVVFDELPGIVQRAVAWDSGYVLDTASNLIKVWTLDGLSMNELAVSVEEFKDVGCTTKVCPQTGAVDSYSNLQCNGTQMLLAAKCIVEAVTSDAIHEAMWSTGGNPEAVPGIDLKQHTWTSEEKSFIVYAIHTRSQDPSYDTCSNDGYGSLVVPCHGYKEASAKILAKRTEPEPSELVMTWLKEFQTSKPSKFNLMLLVPIIGGVALLLAALVFVFIRRKRRQQEQLAAESNWNYHHNRVDKSLSPDADGWSHNKISGESQHTASSNDDNSGTSRILKILIDDPQIGGKRIPWSSLQFQQLISKGAYGEIWICQYDEQQVAGKRLLQSKPQTSHAIEKFAYEIQLSANLQHVNIIQFMGVAWNTLNNLVMVMEYLPTGDLQNYLAKNADLLSWARDKIHIAIGIARALAYLHSQTPPVIHRDLKSKNVLLTERLDAKLIDFGVSRGWEKDENLTAGVGTLYWTAPEVLSGTQYTQQSDIYSFGVLLSELDTGKIPYHDAFGRSGELLQPVQILNGVIDGKLRPNLRFDCPDRIHHAAEACLQSDPQLRPTAQELVEILEGRRQEQTYYI